MDDTKLKGIVADEIRNAVGHYGGLVSSDRSEAIERYLGEPYGDELPDRSQVVSKDLQEVIEWMLPSLMRTFTADEIVVFDPVGPEDEEVSRQETDYLNYVFLKKNKGWVKLYTWFKDALIEKNGIIKYYWSDEEKNTREEYENLTDDQFMMMNNDDELELIEHTEKMAHQMPDGMIMEGGMDGYPIFMLHDAVFTRTVKTGELIIDNVPPDEFGIAKGHNSIFLQDCSFCYHRMEKTVSELTAEGYDTDMLVSGSTLDTEEDSSRNLLNDDGGGHESADPTMRKVEVYECYMRVDYDGDGIAELRKITYSNNHVLDNEEVDRIPFAAITPVILTHKFYGLSIDDRIGDLAKIKTAIWRNALDNLYLANNQRIAANELVNLDDLLSTRPMQIIQTKGETPPGNHLFPLPVQDIASNAFQMLEYTDRIREGRTGVSQQADLVEDLLSNNKGDMSVARVMSAAEQQIELIARIFAETGVKELYLGMHELNRKHQDQNRNVKLRGKWVTVNPSQWFERTDMTIKVGLGTDDRYKQIAGIQNVLMAQEKLLSYGMQGILVSEQNIYEAHKDLTKFAQLDADKYFTAPNSPEAMQTKQQRAQAAQSQSNPLAEAEKIKGQFKIQAEQMQIQYKGQMEQMKAQYERELEMVKMQLGSREEMARLQTEMANNAADRASKEAIAIMQAEIKALIEGMKVDIGRPGVGTEIERTYDASTGTFV